MVLLRVKVSKIAYLCLHGSKKLQKSTVFQNLMLQVTRPLVQTIPGWRDFKGTKSPGKSEFSKH